MNFKTYLAILEDEGLEESPLADGLLIQAMELQGQIKRLTPYKDAEKVMDEIERLEELKIKCIWDAIDLARLYPPDSDMYKMTLRVFQRQNKREYKGFLNEYQILKVNKKNNVGATNSLPRKLTPVEQRVSDRWEQAMKRMKGRGNGQN